MAIERPDAEAIWRQAWYQCVDVGALELPAQAQVEHAWASSGAGPRGRQHTAGPVQFQPGLSLAEFVAIRHRGQMLSRRVSGALAAGISLSGMCWPATLAFPPRRPCVLPVPCLPAPDDTDQRYAVRRYEASAAHLVRGVVPFELNQDEPVGIGTQAPPGRALPHGLAHLLPHRHGPTGLSAPELFGQFKTASAVVADDAFASPASDATADSEIEQTREPYGSPATKSPARTPKI